jgi:hypothetical protein
MCCLHVVFRLRFAFLLQYLLFDLKYQHCTAFTQAPRLASQPQLFSSGGNETVVGVSVVIVIVIVIGASEATNNSIEVSE